MQRVFCRTYMHSMLHTLAAHLALLQHETLWSLLSHGAHLSCNLQACPVGTTTPSTGATTAAACSVVLAGYQAIFDTERRVIGAAPCLVGTFSAEGSGVCMPCPAGLTTQVCSVEQCLRRRSRSAYSHLRASCCLLGDCPMLATQLHLKMHI